MVAVACRQRRAPWRCRPRPWRTAFTGCFLCCGGSAALDSPYNGCAVHGSCAVLAAPTRAARNALLDGFIRAFRTALTRCGSKTPGAPRTAPSLPRSNAHLKRHYPCGYCPRRPGQAAPRPAVELVLVSNGPRRVACAALPIRLPLRRADARLRCRRLSAGRECHHRRLRAKPV